MQATRDFSHYVRHLGSGLSHIDLAVEGVSCAGCMSKIERGLSALPDVTLARVNLTDRRVALEWKQGTLDPARFIDRLAELGYKAYPFEPVRAEADRDRAGELPAALPRRRRLCRDEHHDAVDPGVVRQCQRHDPGAARFLPLAVGADCLAGGGLFGAAVLQVRIARACGRARTNMDVPISIGIVLALAMSVAETIHHAEHAYFDAALMLLAFLLAGRYLDQSMRRKTRAVAGNLAALKGETATKFVGADEISVVPIAAVQAGDIVLLRPGERSAVDGSVIEGQSKIDQSLITGETLPVKAGPGTAVYAGTLNLSGALRVRVSAASEGTLLAEISRLLDNAVQARSRYVQLADRASRLYAPVVHAAALLTMLGWAAFGATWHDAIVTAISVLIITCPCALGLAIPAVQTVVVGRHVPDRRAAQFRRRHRAAGRSRPRRVRQDGNADLAGTRCHQCRRCSERRVRTRRAACAWPAIIPSPPRWRGPPGQRRRWPGSRRSQARACVASSTGSKSGWAGRRSAARTRSPTRSCAGIPRLPSSPSVMAKRSMSLRCGSACAPMRPAPLPRFCKAGIEVEILSGDREPAVRHAAADARNS